MLTLSSILAVGFLLGIRHATDPDHVVAVTAIASGEHSLRRASRTGALWGIGHSLTVMLVGGTIVLFRLSIPARLGLALELAVAVMLIVLGVAAIRHRDHDPRESMARPIVIGLVHGMAGSAFVAMLVLAAVPGALEAIAYLVVFGIGTVVGMACITAGIALPTALSARRFINGGRYLRLASGVASIAVGLFLAHRVSVVDGLFAAVPHWSPE